MEDNLKLPAYPQLTYDTIPRGDGNHIAIQYVDKENPGFTKLELASLMIAQGMAGTWLEEANGPQYRHIAEVAVSIAKIVLEEANK